MTLNFAAAEGLSEVCEELLRSKEDINSRDELGWTPLMHAVRNGHSDLANRLLFHGADACLSNHHGVTAFTLAVLQCENLLGVLYDSLTTDLRQTESNNALQVACIKGLYDAVRWILVNTLVQVNHVSEFTGVTALHLAIIGHNHEIVELLLSFGAEANILTELGQDGFALAEINNDKRTLFLLGQAYSPKKTGCFHFKKFEKTEFENIDPIFTENKILLNINGDIVLKNSPNRPVFKTKNKLRLDFTTKNKEMNLLGSPSLRSVFLSPKQFKTSPQAIDCGIEEDNFFDGLVDDETKLMEISSMKSEFSIASESCRTPCSRQCDYSFNDLISPRCNPPTLASETPTQTQNRGRKRKLQSVCSSLLKRFTKRRTQSLEDSGSYTSFDCLKKGGIDLAQLLGGLGLDDFYPIFKEQELDMWTFLTLTSEDLSAMGIHDQNSQAQILIGVETLRKAQL